MKTSRRNFIREAALGVGTVFCGVRASAGDSLEDFTGYPDRIGVLVDVSLCIGCRKCEEACKQSNHLPPCTVPLEDQSIFERQRRTDAENYTVVNR